MLGNSQATGVGVPPGSSYPALLRAEHLPQHEWHVWAMSGWSVRDFDTHLESVLLVEADLVIVQVGIVECSRRILSEREKRLLYLVPGARLVTRFLHDRRQRVILLRNRLGFDTRLFEPADFEGSLVRVLERARAAGAQTIVLEIPSFGPRYEQEHFPLINDDIRIFNAVLRRHGAVPFVDAGDELESIWQPATVHFNEQGHALAAARIAARIREHEAAEAS